MGPAVSIIIPVYNAEKSLRRCIDSVLHQEYTDFELLLINDGSTDSSGSICDAYAQQDCRVHVIHKENTGVSDTRNAGLDRAKGTFVQFLDSDDWITPDATKLLVRTAQSTACDMVIADFYRVVGERVSHMDGIGEDAVLSREQFAEHMMENPADFYYGVLWNKLYRREIIEGHHLRMDVDIHWCEDFIFNLEYMLHAQTFSALKAPIYYYVKTKGSLVTQNASISKVIRTKLTVFEYYHNFYKHVLDAADYDKKRLQVYRFLIDSAGDNGVLSSLLPGTTKKLGDERISTSPGAVSSDGILADAYRSRKLLDRYLEIVALENDLSLPEARLLLYLNDSCQICSKKELADFTGMNRGSLTLTLQRLSIRGMIEVDEQRVPGSKSARKQLKVSFLPSADPILADLAAALNDYDQVCFSNFTPEEHAAYTALTQKIKANMQKVLQ